MSDPFSSHLEILSFLKDNFDLKSVIEIGTGEYSTKYFVENFKKVISIENANQLWFEKTNSQFQKKRNFTGRMFLGCKELYDYIDKLENFDLCFNDGRSGDRWKVANHMIYKSKIIISHDSQASCYFYEKVHIPFGWYWIDVTRYNPWTAILTNRKDIHDELIKNFQCEVYDNRSFPFKRYLIDNKDALTEKDWRIFRGEE